MGRVACHWRVAGPSQMVYSWLLQHGHTTPSTLLWNMQVCEHNEGIHLFRHLILDCCYKKSMPIWKPQLTGSLPNFVGTTDHPGKQWCINCRLSWAYEVKTKGSNYVFSLISSHGLPSFSYIYIYDQISNLENQKFSNRVFDVIPVFKQCYISLQCNIWGSHSGDVPGDRTLELSPCLLSKKVIP